MGGLGMAVAFWMTGRRDPSLELKLEASEVPSRRMRGGGGGFWWRGWFMGRGW